jgi:hypothetical protein
VAKQVAQESSRAFSSVFFKWRRKNLNKFAGEKKRSKGMCKGDCLTRFEKNAR